MSGDLQVRIWAALDASDGDLYDTLVALREGLKDPDILEATLRALMVELRAAADSLLTAPLAALDMRPDDPRAGQALAEAFDEVENPTRTHELGQTLTRAYLHALVAAVEAEVPRWRAARGEPESPET